jgi:DNA sulfur modification protein DndB
MDFLSLTSVCEINQPLPWKIDMESVIAERDWFLTHVANKSRILLAPFTFSARECVKVNKGKGEFLPDKKMVILFGQEKILGLAAAVQFLQNKKDLAELEQKPRMVKLVEQALERLTTIPITMQVYLDLSLEAERKIYNDSHMGRRYVHAGEKMQYDQRCEFTVLTRKVAENIEEVMEIEQKLSRMMEQSTALTSLTIMQKCTLAMWEGDLDGHTVKVSNTLIPAETRERLTEEFYRVWLELFPEKAYNRQQYVSGLAGIQIALAYTVYLLTKEQRLPHRKAIHKLLKLKSSCTWEHHDPLFAHLFDPTTGRIKNHNKKCSIQKTARKFLMSLTEEAQ